MENDEVKLGSNGRPIYRSYSSHVRPGRIVIDTFRDTKICKPRWQIFESRKVSINKRVCKQCFNYLINSRIISSQELFSPDCPFYITPKYCSVLSLSTSSTTCHWLHFPVLYSRHVRDVISSRSWLRREYEIKKCCELPPQFFSYVRLNFVKWRRHAAAALLRLHWHIFIAHFLLRRKFANVNWHFLTHFPRRDVYAEKLTCQLFHSKNTSV